MSPSAAFSRSAVSWLSQVAASLGATLLATMIYGAFPKPAPKLPEVAPALTSGGKFAARVPQVAPPQAYDGLDAMPLPVLAKPVMPASFLAVPVPAVGGAPEEAVVPPAGSGGTAGDAGPERRPKARQAARQPARADARRIAAVAPAIPADLPVAAAPLPEPDGDLVQRVASGVRDVWTVTASMGGSLVSRLVP